MIMCQNQACIIGVEEAILLKEYLGGLRRRKQKGKSSDIVITKLKFKILIKLLYLKS